MYGDREVGHTSNKWQAQEPESGYRGHILGSKLKSLFKVKEVSMHLRELLKVLEIVGNTSRFQFLQ
jgi:hypothetical protein